MRAHVSIHSRAKTSSASRPSSYGSKPQLFFEGEFIIYAPTAIISSDRYHSYLDRPFGPGGPDGSLIVLVNFEKEPGDPGFFVIERRSR